VASLYRTLFAIGMFLITSCSRAHGVASGGQAVELLAQQHVPGGVLAVVRNGVVVDEGVWGSANLQLGVPVQRTTLFQLASVTKVFSAIALLSLEVEGKLHLEDPISKYLDGLPQAWQAVTLWQLVSHTSGLPDVIADPNKPLDDTELARSADEALAFAASKPNLSPAGSHFAYDQTNYVIVARIIERVSGTKFRNFLTARVLAGMAQTRWADAREILTGRADMNLQATDDPLPIAERAAKRYLPDLQPMF
jgi:CubicO group peptidase (beta-lactamase class C family)